MLGQGGMSDVYLAATSSTAPIDFTKLVALKRLKGDYYADVELITMFLDEARIAARLNHPNVVQTLEISETDGELVLAMEYLEGETLARIRDRALLEMPLGMHLSILCEALSGIDYAHKLNDYDGTPLCIVHRDVTPQNIFVTFDGRVKVMDFGIAMASGRIAETRHGVIKGKVAYMAPEQTVADAPIDQRADLFAVGVMIYEACVRRRMWAGVSDSKVLSRLAEGDIPTSIQEIDPSLPDELEQICERALSFDMSRRYASAAELQADLDAYIDAHERRPSPRQIGKLVATLFADQRNRTRELIESQMSEMVPVPAARRSLQSISLIVEHGSRPDASEISDLRPFDSFADTDEPTKIELAPESSLVRGAPTSSRPPVISVRIVLLSLLCLLALLVLWVSLTDRS